MRAQNDINKYLTNNIMRHGNLILCVLVKPNLNLMCEYHKQMTSADL